MDYYGPPSSSSRGRSSYRGSSYRSRGDSYRGSRGSRGSTSRGRGGSSYSSYPSKYESPSSKYSSAESSKYGSSYSKYDDFYRRSDNSFGREHRTDLSEITTRKRDRPDGYSSSQGVTRRHEDEEYRSSRYSGGSSYPERSYEESRPFKKPRAEFKPSEYRVKEPLRTRAPRGRIIMRGTVSRRGRDSFTSRRRGSSFSSRSATTSEILAIRRAKLLQNRLKEHTSAEAKEKTEKKEEGEVEESPKTEKVAAENGEAKKDAAPKEERERTTFYGRPFMKLHCPSCDVKCITFKEYITHLHQSVHIKAMKEKSDNLKTSLAAMRIAQREEQKKADEDDLTSMTTRSSFCSICKLNYSQERATHQASELHKKLKEFLMPYCKICRIQFDSPMSYESHMCSLEHLRRKNDIDEREKRSASGILDKFMVLDSVGSGDEGDEKEEEAPKEEKDEDLLLGLEFIHDVKAKYCEVCRQFLPRVKDYERVLKRHCQTKEHLRCYLHYGNETLLEQINADGDAAEKKDEKEVETKEVEELLEGDKLWDGLTELLNEAQPRAKSEDEDEEEGGRFDRFKSKEQKENGNMPSEDTDEKIETADEEVPKAVEEQT